MRWPDPTNSDDNILTFILTDPAGRLAQLSYDYGASNGNNASPDIQHSTVEHPMAGTGRPRSCGPMAAATCRPRRTPRVPTPEP